MPLGVPEYNYFDLVIRINGISAQPTNQPRNKTKKQTKVEQMKTHLTN